jgi:hypothetical protein
MRIPKPVWLATHGIFYTRMRLQNQIYIASPGREILICCYNDLTRPLKSRHHAEDTKAIHSNSSFPCVPKDQLLGRFQFMYVTVVFRTEKKSANFKNWLRFKSNLRLEFGRNVSFAFISKFNVASLDRSTMT